MKYACWRCKHEVERTTMDCPGCGKALAPVPWLRKAWLSPRAFNDAVVSDYLRRVEPVTSVLMALFFVFILSIGVWTLLGRREAMDSESTGRAEVRATMEERKVPADLQDLVMGLLDVRLAAVEAFGFVGVLFIIIGAMGATWVTFASFMIRRLLLAVPSVTAESTVPNEYRFPEPPEAKDRT